jgi:hypothetical protein
MWGALCRWVWQSLQQQLSLATSTKAVVQRDVDTLRQEVADGLKEVRQNIP